MGNMVKMFLPVLALLARIVAPKALDWVAASTAIPTWIKPIVTEVLTGLLAALTASTAAAQLRRSRPRARKVRAGIRKALK